MRTGRVVMAVPPGQGFVRGARTATGAGALGRDGLESPAGRSTLRSVHPAGRVGMMNLLATKKVRAIEVVTARGAERGEGQAEQRPVMSGAGRGPTFPGAGHQVTSLQATQLVADRKDFRGQREPTEAIIGNGHGHGCQLWTQQHRSHQSAVNVAGGAPVATAVNSSRSAVADDDLVLARRGVGSLADFEFGVFGVCETCPGCSDAVVAAARPGCSTRLLDPAGGGPGRSVPACCRRAGSTLTSSAPIGASCAAATGPGRLTASETTRIPASGGAAGALMGYASASRPTS